MRVRACSCNVKVPTENTSADKPVCAITHIDLRYTHILRLEYRGREIEYAVYACYYVGARCCKNSIIQKLSKS